MSAARGLAGHVGVSAACEALGVARATFYRRRRPKTGQRQPRPAPARALGEAERTEVFRVLCSPRFTDRAPAEVYATLLDEGVYLCSERTMYRVLAENRAVRERRAQRSHPNHPKPEVVARALRRGVVLGHHGLLTPGQVHLGRAPEVIRQRQDVLAAAYAARPERFVAGPPRAAELKAEVWINRALPVSEVDGAEPGDGADGHGKEGSLN